MRSYKHNYAQWRLDFSAESFLYCSKDSLNYAIVRSSVKWHDEDQRVKTRRDYNEARRQQHGIEPYTWDRYKYVHSWNQIELRWSLIASVASADRMKMEMKLCACNLRRPVLYRRTWICVSRSKRLPVPVWQTISTAPASKNRFKNDHSANPLFLSNSLVCDQFLTPRRATGRW